MNTPLDNFYISLDEPLKSCMLALRDVVVNYNEQIVAEWKWSTPFFKLNGKMFCYLWKDKKTGLPYISIYRANQLSHPLLETSSRKAFGLIYIDPLKDIPVDEIYDIFDQVVNKFHKV